MPEANSAQKIIDLRNQIDTSTRLRAEASASLQVAENQRTEVYNRLKEMGIEPDQAEVELKALEEQIEKTTAELSEALNKEVHQYNDIIAKTKASLGGKS